MANPPNRPRDDRRMHEGEKPGLSDKIDRGHQDRIELDPDDSKETSPTTDRRQESALGGDVATRSKE